MDKILQTGLSAGMSATAAFHSGKPNPVDAKLNSKNILPQYFKPDARARVSIPTKKGPPIEASYLSIGAWSWGDSPTWQWKDDELPAHKEAWKHLYDAGINFIDTAEAYGHGKSEEITGELVAGLPRESVVIQTKWLGLPVAANNLLHSSDAPLKALEDSLKRMKLDYVDILLVHGYIPLATNQCEFSILRRLPEVDGELQSYKDLGVVYQSYSSLAQGRLTGKYTVDNPPPATHRLSNYDMKDIEPTLQVLREIARSRISAGTAYPP